MKRVCAETLGKILELVDYDFSILLLGDLPLAKHIEIDADCVATSRGNTGCKNVFVHCARYRRAGRAGDRRKRGPAWLPVDRLSENAGWNCKARNVDRDVIRLNDVLRIFVGGVAPAADLDVEFPAVIFRTHAVPRRHR